MPPEDSSTSSPQEPVLDAPQPVPESPSPTIEAPAETPPSEPTPSAPEPAPAPTEAVPAPDSTSSPQAETAPDSAEATTGTQPPTQTAQMGRNEPLPPEPEPFDSPRQSSEQAAQDKPTPEPPSAAASAPAPVIPQTGILHAVHDVLVKARVAIQDHKRKKRDKIMTALNTKSKITNDEVEKLLHVSDATATRYLSALEKEGKIKQVGKTGQSVMYQKI